MFLICLGPFKSTQLYRHLIHKTSGKEEGKYLILRLATSTTHYYSTDFIICCLGINLWAPVQLSKHPKHNSWHRHLPLVCKMLEGKAVIRESDMPEMMQSHAMELAYQALDLHEVSDCKSIAQHIKQVIFHTWLHELFFLFFLICSHLVIILISKD